MTNTTFVLVIVIGHHCERKHMAWWYSPQIKLFISLLFYDWDPKREGKKLVTMIEKEVNPGKPREF